MNKTRIRNAIAPLAILAMALSALAVPDPARAYTTESYAWHTVQIGGGGAIPTLVIHPKVADLMYIGADVGGLDRWDATNQQWIPTLDFLRHDEWNMYGCVGAAVDRSDTTGNTLYVATGLYSYTGFEKGELMKSTDRGEHWTRNGVKIWGASNWEQLNPQRVAVDPNNNQAVYYASREGLFRSLDGDATLTKIPGAPLGDQSTLNTGGTSGISCVMIDKTSGTVNGRTKRVYIVPAGSNVWVSNDGGDTYSAISGSPASVRRMVLNSTGVLYTAGDTGIFKYSGGAWSTLTPPNMGTRQYRAIDIDPANDNNVICSEHGWFFGNFMFRSTNGGATWSGTNSSGLSITETDNIPWYSFGLGDSTFEQQFDPFHAGQVWMTDWYQVWKTTNEWANPVNYGDYTKGHEETVQMACMMSPPSGQYFLVTGVADDGGFMINNVANWPKEISGMGNISGQDFEENNPSVMAFAGFNAWGPPGTGGYTTDGGTTFHNFASMPNTNGGGRLAISASSQRIVWAESGSGVFYSDNLGGSWTAAAGAPSNFTQTSLFWYDKPLASDRKNGNKFYIATGSNFYISTNGGANWSVTNSSLPTASNGNQDLCVNFTTEGDLWLSVADNGLYHSTNSGSTWTKLANVQAAYLAGFGKGSTAGSSSLYILGKVDGDSNEGVFRSDNAGVNWVKIDIQRPYPGDQPEDIVGDRQTYGQVYVGTQIGILYGKKTAVTVPPAPTGLTATAGNTQIALAWNASSGATSYYIKRSTVSGSGYATVASPTATNYTNTGLTNGTTYYYVATAVNTAGESGNSNQASATPQLAIPVVPTGLTATSGNTQVSLTWAASTGATSYNVKRSTVSGSGYVIVSSPTTTTFTNTGLTNGTTYYYVVSAVNASGESANSSQASATPIASPAAPAGLAAVPGIAQAWLTWTASTGATTYNVKRSTVSGSGYVTVGSRATTYFMNTGLTNATTYYYVVTAVNAGGESANSGQASAAPSATVPQAQIASGTATIDGTVEAAWNNAPSYLLSKSTGTISSYSDCTATWQAMWDTTNLYVLVNVTDDVKVNDSVNAWDDDAVEVYLDADHNGGTAYDANDRQIVFGWGDAAAVEGGGRAITGVTFAKADPTSTSYRIEAKIPWAVEAFTPTSNAIIGIDAMVDDDDDGGARDGHEIWNDGTDQAWTNPSLFGAGKLTGGVTPPSAPTGLAATASNTQVALSWTASTGATSYNVKRSTVSGSGYTTVSSPTTTSYTNTGLTNGTTYYYVVTAVNSGGESGNSSQVSAVPVAAGNTHSGTWACKAVLTTTAGFTNCAQVINVPTNTNYVASLWIKGGGSIQLKVVDINWAVTLAQVQCNATSTWQQYTLPQFNTGTNTQIVYVLQDQYGGTAGTAYVDDTFLGPSGGANLLTNAGFESGAASWAPSGVFTIVQNP